MTIARRGWPRGVGSFRLAGLGEAFAQTNVTLLESPVTSGGLDTELLLARSHKDMDDIISSWREQKDYYDVKLKKKRYLEPGDSATFNVFRTGGFFDLITPYGLLGGVLPWSWSRLMTGSVSEATLAATLDSATIVPIPSAAHAPYLTNFHVSPTAAAACRS